MPKSTAVMRDRHGRKSNIETKPVSTRRSKATAEALKREPRHSASRNALAAHARAVARVRGKADLRRSARKAARTRKAA